MHSKVTMFLYNMTYASHGLFTFALHYTHLNRDNHVSGVCDVESPNLSYLIFYFQLFLFYF